MRFTKYGFEGFSGISFEAILAQQKETGDLLARAEDSGSEGCYCEIAIWNHATYRFERFAFEKFHGGEIEGKSAEEIAEHCAAQVNAAGYMGARSGLIHSLPNHGGSTPLEEQCRKLIAAAAKRKPPANPTAAEFCELEGALTEIAKLVKPIGDAKAAA
jgi:hypothetical protein